MRHNKAINHLGRKSSHRKALMANMASSLIKHKRIQTTVAKAKALKTYVEPLITKSKEDTTHSRRVVFSYLKDKEAVKEMFGVIAPKVADRPGGYTRVSTPVSVSVTAPTWLSSSSSTSTRPLSLLRRRKRRRLPAAAAPRRPPLQQRPLPPKLPQKSPRLSKNHIDNLKDYR